MDITRWSTPKSDDYILCSQRWKSFIQSAKIRPGADCGSDHELLITKFRFKLNKVGKTTRPFRYDLNKIIYDYTVEVTKRLKGLDLIGEFLKKYEWMFPDIAQEVVIKIIPKRKNTKRKVGCLRRPYKYLRKKEK